MRENRPYGSEGGVGESRSRPLLLVRKSPSTAGPSSGAVQHATTDRAAKPANDNADRCQGKDPAVLWERPPMGPGYLRFATVPG